MRDGLETTVLIHRVGNQGQKGKWAVLQGPLCSMFEMNFVNCFLFFFHYWVWRGAGSGFTAQLCSRISGIFQMVPLSGCWHDCSFALWEPLGCSFKAETAVSAGQIVGKPCALVGTEPCRISDHTYHFYFHCPSSWQQALSNRVEVRKVLHSSPNTHTHPW